MSLETLIALDQQLFLWLNAQHHPSLDALMHWATGDKSWWWLYLGIVIGLAYRFGRQVWQILVQIAVLIAVADQFASGLLKPLVKRLRPCYEPYIAPKVHLVTEGCGGQYGFISSHAANTFALATFLYLLTRQYLPRNSGVIAYLFFSWALWVSYTRIYVGVHYPADVLVGALSGVVWAVLVRKGSKLVHSV